MKKFALVIIAIIVAFSSVYPPEVAHANLISKPISIAAKKAAKIPIKNTAVEMANQIVSDYLVRELIEGVKTDDGYSPVCMDGKKDSIKDCPPDKRAQVKTKLSSTDKSKLEKTVESVLEKKTNTSSKWGKFLDIFVPLFLVSGAIEIISASLDGDILSFFDEIAQDALIDSGLLKPLTTITGPTEPTEMIDFSSVIASATVTHAKISYHHYEIVIHAVNKPKAVFDVTFVADDNVIRTNTVTGQSAFKLTLASQSSRLPVPADPPYKSEAVVYLSSFAPSTNQGYSLAQNDVYRGGVYSYDDDSADLAGHAWIANSLVPQIQSAEGDVNKLLNLYVAYINSSASISFSIPNLKPTEPEVKTDYGKQSATDKIKDANGNVPLKGMNSFTFTYGDTHIYPSDQSTTGWKDKTTGEDITVVEDDVVVDDGSGPTDPTDPGGTDDPPDKDKTKEQLEDESKKLGNLVTTRFPFSLPWDFVAMVKLLYAEPMTPKWEVEGTEEIPLNFTINLNFLDPYIGWFRGFIMVGFVISVIFMHSRFMGGSK